MSRPPGRDDRDRPKIVMDSGKPLSASMIAAFGRTNELDIAANVQEVLIELLDPYPNHVFSPQSEEALSQLAESIKDIGIIDPIIVKRQGNSPRFTILAGHNRTAACKRIGKETILARVLTPDFPEWAAVAIVNESNLLQREKILPSERARSYKQLLDALQAEKRRENFLQGISDDGHIVSNSVIALTDAMTTTRAQIYRFLRLNSIVAPLLKRIDREEISLRVAGELSYVPGKTQSIVEEVLAAYPTWRISWESARKIREITSKGDDLTAEQVMEIHIGTTRGVTERSTDIAVKAKNSSSASVLISLRKSKIIDIHEQRLIEAKVRQAEREAIVEYLDSLGRLSNAARVILDSEENPEIEE